jgi:2-oxoglutarate ferredoxin oxidoreductase subunit delta
VDACPLDNIEMSGDFNLKGNQYARIKDENKCNKCGICFRMCPDLVIEIEKK